MSLVGLLCHWYSIFGNMMWTKWNPYVSWLTNDWVIYLVTDCWFMPGCYLSLLVLFLLWMLSEWNDTDRKEQIVHTKYLSTDISLLGMSWVRYVREGVWWRGVLWCWWSGSRQCLCVFVCIHTVIGVCVCVCVCVCMYGCVYVCVCVCVCMCTETLSQWKSSVLYWLR